MNTPCILKSTKFIDMVTKLPEIHAKGFEILEKFCHTNRPFCQSPDSRRVTFTVKHPPPTGLEMGGCMPDCRLLRLVLRQSSFTNQIERPNLIGSDKFILSLVILGQIEGEIPESDHTLISQDMFHLWF